MSRQVLWIRPIPETRFCRNSPSRLARMWPTVLVAVTSSSIACPVTCLPPLVFLTCVICEICG